MKKTFFRGMLCAAVVVCQVIAFSFGAFASSGLDDDKYAKRIPMTKDIGVWQETDV